MNRLGVVALFQGMTALAQSFIAYDSASPLPKKDSSGIWQLSQSFTGYDASTYLNNVVGYSSTDLGITWGDAVHLTGTGVLDSITFPIFNSDLSTGGLDSFNVKITFSSYTTGLNLGQFTGTYSFSSSLDAGYYTLVTATGLSNLSINLAEQDILITQQIQSRTGDASRLGIVAGTDPNAISVGSDLEPGKLYVSSGTIDAGYYSTPSISDVAVPYTVTLLTPTIPEPSTVAALSALGLLGVGVWRRSRR